MISSLEEPIMHIVVSKTLSRDVGDFVSEIGRTERGNRAMTSFEHESVSDTKFTSNIFH